MKRRIAVILLLQVLCFGSVSQQIEPVHSHRLSGYSLNDLPCGHNPRIEITPALPAMSDPIRLTAAGVWPDSCIPEYQSHQMVDNIIRLDAVVVEPPGAICSTVVLDWGFPVDVGALITGSYRVDLYIADHRFAQTPVLCASKSFIVVEQVYETCLPLITK